MHRRVPVLAVAMGVLLLPAAAAPVLGHLSLVRSEPEAGSTVTNVDIVTLVFNEALKADVSSFKLAGPDGSTIGTGTATAARRMTLGGLDLGPGEHTVRWAAAGGDGHIERGTFTFTVEAGRATEDPASPSPPRTVVASGATGGPAPAATATAPAGAATAPAGAATAPPGAVTGSPAPDPGAASAPGAPSGAAAPAAADVLIPIVAGLVLVGLIGLLVLRRRRTA